MATLYINRPNLELRIDGTALAVYDNGQRQSSLPLKLIERVIIQHITTFDSRVLLKLAEHGATTLLLSARNSQRIALILGNPHNEAAIRIAQSQRSTDPDFVLAFAISLVRAKLQHQRQLLQHAQNQRPDQRKPLHNAIQSISAILAVHDNATNLESLRGFEGAAARAYFKGYAAILPPALNFTGRNRRPPRDPVNACLSLAYTLLHFDAVRAAHAAGLDPLVGFYHQPSIGRESLASDLIEPLRPHIDTWVWNLFSQRLLRTEHFTQDKGACLLGKAGREHFYAAWEQHAALHRRALRSRCTRLVRTLRQTAPTWDEHNDIEAGEVEAGEIEAGETP